jgi:hypothetical protein
MFNFPLCKLYTNSLMSSLNSRRGWKFTSAKGSTALQSDGNLGIISTEDFLQTPLTPTSASGKKHYRASQNIPIKLREGVYRPNRTISLSRPVSCHSLSFSHHSRGSDFGIVHVRLRRCALIKIKKLIQRYSYMWNRTEPWMKTPQPSNPARIPQSIIIRSLLRSRRSMFAYLLTRTCLKKNPKTTP